MDAEPDLVRRMKAVEATERHFAGRRWKPGSVDCVQMGAFHARRFGWKLPRIAPYRSIAQGRARLAGLGCKTLAELLDRIGMERIAPAYALIGDLIVIPGDDEMGALQIALGNGAMKGFREDHDGLVAIRDVQLIIGAWRIVPPAKGKD